MRNPVAALALCCLAASAFAQTSDEIFVATYIEVQPGAAAQAVSLLNEYVRAVGQEPGNLRVEAFREDGRPNRFILMEAWNERGEFDAHELAAQTQSFRDRLHSIARAPLDQRVNSGFSVDIERAAGGAEAVFVFTHVDVPGNWREDAEMLLEQLVAASRKDDGLIRYDVYQQLDRPNHFTVFSAWDNRRNFDANGNTEHWRNFRASLSPRLGALYDERLYSHLTSP